MKLDELMDKYLTEAKMKDFDSYVKQIARMTDRNDHNAARKTAAELMKLVTKKHEYEGFVDQYVSISKEHLRKGSLTRDLGERRDDTDRAFFAQAKKDLPKDLFDKLWSAF